MPQGRRTPDEVRRFIVQLKQDAPELSHPEIRALVEARFPTTIDKSTVGRILNEETPRAGKGRDPRQEAGLNRHWEKLVGALDVLKGIQASAANDSDLVTWWSRPHDASWPVSKGRVWREGNGRLRVQLEVENRVEWPLLRQHIPDDGLWHAVENAKEAMARDISARLRCLDSIKDRIRLPRNRGGIGLLVGNDLGFSAVARPEVTVHFVFGLFVQAVTGALGRPQVVKTREQFHSESPHTLHLGGIPVVRSKDEALRQDAVEFFLKEQQRVAESDEAEASAQAYVAVESATDEVNRCLDRIRLLPSLPLGSECDICRDWVRTLG